MPVMADFPLMSADAPHPSLDRRGDDLWVAYRTRRADHFAVIRFIRVAQFVGHPGEGRDVHLPLPAGSDLRRWIIPFPGETLEVTARDAAIVVRAVQAQSGAHALAALGA